MDGLFMIDDDIDLSDDENFLQTLPGYKNKENKDTDQKKHFKLAVTFPNLSNVPKQVLGRSPESKLNSVPTKRFSFHETEGVVTKKTKLLQSSFSDIGDNTNNLLVNNKISNPSVNTTKLSEIFNFEDLDDDDKLLSELELPTNQTLNHNSGFSKGDFSSVSRKSMLTMIESNISCGKKVKALEGIEGEQSNSYSRNVLDKSYNGFYTNDSNSNQSKLNVNYITQKCAVSPCIPKKSNLSSISTVNFEDCSSRKAECAKPLMTNFKDAMNPKSKKVTKIDARQRRFPGPAGILPNIERFDQLDVLKSPEIPNKKEMKAPLTPKTPIKSLMNLSQENDITLLHVWDEVCEYVKEHFPNCCPTLFSLILNEGRNKTLTSGKVSLIAAVIKSISYSGSGGSMVLEDTSGQIYSTIHSNVLEEFELVLRQGNGIILKDISLFSPSARKHYVNITPCNIVQIFSSKINETQSATQQSQTSNQNMKYNLIKKVSNNTIKVLNSSYNKTPSNLSTSDLKKNCIEDIERFFTDEAPI